jgi:hypothetical protein
VPLQPQPSNASQIIVHVNWQSQGIAGIKIVLIETAETLYTDANGIAKFNVKAGHYTVRAFDINRGGPGLQSLDFDVEVQARKTTTLDVVDCLGCV